MADLPMPAFERPPLVEVAFAAQFEPLLLRTPDLAVFWMDVLSKRGMTTWREGPPIAGAVELFGIPQAPRLQIQFEQPVQRAMFFDAAETKLVQIQQDRFIHNWLRPNRKPDSYPRYDVLRNDFKAQFEEFCSFVKTRGHGAITTNQAELTYVNQIELEQGASLGDVGALLAPCSGRPTDEFLGPAESAEVALHYVITDPKGRKAGRLHVEATPGFTVQNMQPVVLLKLTARGRYEGDSIDSLMAFFDRAHECIVRGFASLTTVQMQEKWGRIDGSGQ